MNGDLRQAIADELARHADTMRRAHDSDHVRLGCRCGHQRDVVTAAELSAALDRHLTAHRLHVADALIAGPLAGVET